MLLELVVMLYEPTGKMLGLFTEMLCAKFIRRHNSFYMQHACMYITESSVYAHQHTGMFELMCLLFANLSLSLSLSLSSLA